jgi:ABC-type branched-subunit amino acid transport system substrate-binding protein/outer membrane protein assembly factor BamD (BamD/ComL family)
MNALKFITFFLTCSVAFAQTNLTVSDKDYPIRYKKAVQLYAEQRYLQAQDELIVLTHRKYDNAMVPYAHYYYALAAYQLQKYFETRIILRQLMERYPEWKNIDEAYYLYADACFADNYIEEGMQGLSKITDERLKNDVINIQNHWFSKISDISQLKQLNKSFPNNAILAQYLVDAIQKSKFTNKEDLELSDRLTNRFKLGDNTYKKTSPTYQREDDVVDVAVLLPFKTNEFDVSKLNRSNQYIYDMYEGMKIAQTKLESEGINIKLFAFDIDRDTSPMLNLVNHSSFNKIDLLVGPLYPEVNRVANSFARNNSIVQIHPLSNNNSLVKSEKLTFLVQPSYESQAQKSIEFMLTQNPLRTVSIYFGNTKKDSTFAYIYRDKAMERGFSVIAIKKFNTTDDIDTRRTGHIFVVGSDENFGTRVINALDRKKINTPLLATSTAFDFEAASLSIFNRSLYLIQLDYVDRDKEEVKNFRSSYINAQNIIPSYYSYFGYDLLLFYGRILNKGKSSLRSQLDAIEYTQGYTLSGFDYTNGSNENQFVPIMKYQDGKFIQVFR